MIIETSDNDNKNTKENTMNKMIYAAAMSVILSGSVLAQTIEAVDTAAPPSKPLIGIPDFENRTDGHMTRIAPGKYREKNVNVGYDMRQEASEEAGKTVQTDSRRDVYEKQLERNVEFAPGEWKLPESAGRIAADEVAAILTRSGRFGVLSRSKFSFSTREEERKLAYLRNSTEDYMKLCRDLNAKYLVLGSISGFRVDEAKGTAFGVEMARVSTRVTLDLKAVDVGTGEIAYQGTPSKSVNFPIPSGATATEVYDWENSLRMAVREAADDLILGLAKGTGASVTGLETVKIKVESSPSGADIIVDNDFMGNTPATISVDKGRHTIRIERQGYQPWERGVNAYDGLAISPTLEKFSEPPPIEKTN